MRQRIYSHLSLYHLTFLMRENYSIYVIALIWELGKILPVKHLADIMVHSQFSSVAKSCPTLCNPMDCSTPGLPVPHQLLEFTQIHVHWVNDAIQPSHPLSSPSSPTFHLSQHQGLFKWVSSWHEVAKVLEFQLQHQSFHRIFRTDFLSDGLVGSPCSPRDSIKSLLQHHSTKASILWCSAFFIVQLWHPYVTTGKTMATWHISA